VKEQTGLQHLLFSNGSIFVCRYGKAVARITGGFTGAELANVAGPRCTLTPPDPQLIGAWYPGGFKPSPFAHQSWFQNGPFKRNLRLYDAVNEGVLLAARDDREVTTVDDLFTAGKGSANWIFNHVILHFSPRYFAAKTHSTDDSQYCPCNDDSQYCPFNQSTDIRE
jgi:hypothetical protein